MNYKILFLTIFTIFFLLRLFLDYLEYKSRNNPIPSEVNDLYDEQTYLTWKKYQVEHLINGIVFGCIDFIINFVLIISNVYANIANALTGSVYIQTIIIIFIFLGIDQVISIIKDYISNMKIEQKYGFNRTNIQTFISDQIKSFVISFGLIIGLTCLFIVLHVNLEDYILLVFFGILVIIIFLIVFLFPFLSKIFNKFTPLEDGSLKDKLTNLLNKYGYQVRGINVMDASRRTSKSNAYFAGYGKSKTIVLYDTLLKNMEEDEIVAVFAHELGHGLHKDTLKNSFLSIFNIAILVLLAWLLVKFPMIYDDFGFKVMNYGFVLFTLMVIIFPAYSFLIQLLINWLSRNAEYKADAQAVKEGYGKELISALKKLSKENFANLSPNKIVVLLIYSHPPVAERIRNINKEMEKNK